MEPDHEIVIHSQTQTPYIETIHTCWWRCKVTASEVSRGGEGVLQKGVEATRDLDQNVEELRYIHWECLCMWKEHVFYTLYDTKQAIGHVLMI